MPYIKSEYEDLDKYQYYNGNIVYYKKGTEIFHNPYGLAWIGKNGYKAYWINGEYLSKEEFETHPERLKYLNKEYLICLT